MHSRRCVPSAAVAVSPAMYAPPPPHTRPLAMHAPHHARPPSSQMLPFATHAPLFATTPFHHPVDRMTDTCENITFQQLLLRTVTVNCDLFVVHNTFQLHEHF